MTCFRSLAKSLQGWLGAIGPHVQCASNAYLQDKHVCKPCFLLNCILGHLTCCCVKHLWRLQLLFAWNSPLLCR